MAQLFYERAFPMTKADVLRATTFGKRVAEDEIRELAQYFVRTEQWRKLRARDVDIVYSRKRSGKSALYALLLQDESALFDSGILVIPAENVRGAPVFSDLRADPPLTLTALNW